jgi:hypothetical protein
MSILGYLLSGRQVEKAKKLTLEARQEKGGKADQLFQQAYDIFTTIPESSSNYADALYYWGFAILHQAFTKPSDEASKIFDQAITKFSLCKTISSEHLGASIDSGVALMGLAKSKQVSLDNGLYSKAKESFEKAETIQQGSASYNLACLYALHKKNDDCLKALENARDHGLVPDEQDIINDDDLKNVKQLPWFTEYIESLAPEKGMEKTENKVEAKNESFD